MSPLAVDDLAWSSSWRARPVSGKLMLATGLVVAAVVSPWLPGVLAVAVVAPVMTCAFARVPVRLLLLAAAPAALGLVTVLPVVFQLGSPPAQAVTLGPLWLSPETVRSAGAVLMRSTAAILATLVLATTTPVSDLATWASRHRVPGELVDVVVLTYRLVFVVLGTGVALRRAHLGRCVQQAGLRRRWSVRASYLYALVAVSVRRGAGLSHGLSIRGYDACLRTLPEPRGKAARFNATVGMTLAAVWTVVVWPWL